MSQPDGSYPRLNGALLGSGNYEGHIVSLVGKFGGDPQHQFVGCDNVTVPIDTQQAEGMHLLPGTIAEIVGQVAAPNMVVSAIHRIRIYNGCCVLCVFIDSYYEEQFRGCLLIRCFLGTVSVLCRAVKLSDTAQVENRKTIL